jgi:hypothetical protein
MKKLQRHYFFVRSVCQVLLKVWMKTGFALFELVLTIILAQQFWVVLCYTLACNNEAQEVPDFHKEAFRPKNQVTFLSFE